MIDNNIKRPLDPSDFEEECLPEKRLRSDVTTHHTYGVYASLVSPLLVPDLNLSPLQTPKLFTKRVFRYLDCDLVVDIPEDLTDEKTLEFIAELEKKYNQNSTKEIEQEPMPKIKPLKRKEEKLYIAAEYIWEHELSLGEIATLVGLPKSKIQSLNTRMRGKNPHVLPKSGRHEKLEQQHFQFIKHLIATQSGKLLTLKDIITELLVQFPDLKHINKSTLSKALKKQGYSHKKVATYPQRRNEQRVKADRVDVSRKLVYLLHEDFEVIFTDEISIYLGSRANYGWCEKGQRLSVPVPPKSQFYSIMTAITASKVLGAQAVKGAVTAQDYMGFLCNLIKENGLDKQKKGIVVFADNVRSHRANIVRVKMESCITLLFNASVSPMLNAIEEFFFKFKKEISSNPNSTERELILSIRKAMNVFEPQELSHYVCHVLSYVRKSLQYEDLF